MGKRELQKAVHRQAILEAGEHVLGADLRECVAVDKIAARAGLAKGTVYNYFVDKTALVEAVTQRVEARVVERIGRAMSGRPSAGARLAAAADQAQSRSSLFIVLHHKPTRTRLFMGRVATT